MNRDVLIKINYLFILALLFTSSLTVIYHESPEQMIEGEWVERQWSLEKGHKVSSVALNAQLQKGLREEILRDFEELHLGIWNFKSDRSLIPADLTDNSKIEWLIKGRGHVLELRKNGILTESFQIQKITDDKLVLHLNFDLQVRGILEIVLVRKETLS